MRLWDPQVKSWLSMPAYLEDKSNVKFDSLLIPRPINVSYVL